MKIGFGIAMVVMVAMSATGAQMVSSHAPTTTKTVNASAPAPVNGAQPSGKAVARVNGVALTDRDLMHEMYTLFPYAQQHNGFPKDLEPEIRRGALEMIIFEELVYQEAKRRNMAVPAAKLAKAEAAYRKQFPSREVYREFLKMEANGSEEVMREKIRRAILIDSLLNQEVNLPARITTAQAKAYYDKSSQKYQHGDIVHIQSISIVPPNQSPTAVKEGKQKAEEALKQAKQAKSYKEFGLLAEKVSEDDFRVNMGDHKPVEASQLPPPIAKAAGRMKPGDVGDLIQLGNAYTIIRLESYKPAGKTPFAEVKAKLQADLQKEKTERLRSTLGQKLRKNAKIETL